MAQTLNSTVTTGRSSTKTRTILLWVAQILLAGMFVMAGFMKVAGDPRMIGAFQTIGLGQWFRYFTGGLELLAAIGILIPRLAGISAAVLGAIMVGAIITHLFITGGSPAVPVALLILSAAVAWGRGWSFRAPLGGALRSVRG